MVAGQCVNYLFMDLVDGLIEQGWLKTPRLIEAFRKIKRRDFLPPEMQGLSELNEALPIGRGQTISQPLVVAFMLELLQPEPGDKILDIGSGSGWTTALLVEIIGEKGKVIALEIIPELKEFGERNVAKYNFVKRGIVEFICTDGSVGYEREAPYDKILCSAAVQDEIPKPWQEQVKIGGRIVSSVRDEIWRMDKISDNDFQTERFSGFVFVPLVNS